MSAESSTITAELLTRSPTHVTLISPAVQVASTISCHSNNPHATRLHAVSDLIVTVSATSVIDTIVSVFIVILEIFPGNNGTILSKNDCPQNSASGVPTASATSPIDHHRTHQLRLVILYIQQSMRIFQTHPITQYRETFLNSVLRRITPGSIVTTSQFGDSITYSLISIPVVIVRSEFVKIVLNHRVDAIDKASTILLTGLVGVPVGYDTPATQFTASIVTLQLKLAYSISGSCCTVESTRFETVLIIVTL